MRSQSTYTNPTSLHEQRYHEGVRLFDAGHYWHAHEQWELCWIGAREPEATFFKGMIQAAAALVHWQRSNPRGLWRNWYKSRPKLVAVAPAMHGLDVLALIAAMDRFVLGEGRSGAPPRLSPRESQGNGAS